MGALAQLWGRPAEGLEVWGRLPDQMWGREIISVTTPAAPGTIPAPYAYFAFEDWDPWESSGTGGGIPTISSLSGSLLWGRESGGVYQYKAVDPYGQVSHMLAGLASGRTSLALSVWLEPGETLDLGYADGHWGMGQMSAGGTSPQHWLLLLTSSHAYQWVDGVQVGEYGFLRQETTLYLRQYESCGISELAIWESPSWTEEQAAAIAAALYNEGLGTVYRDGQWWEIDE